VLNQIYIMQFMRFLPALFVLPLVAASVPAQGAQKLVIVSIEGLDFRYLRDADKLHLKIPVLRKLMAKGSMADGVVGVVPTTSFAAAATLMTGVPSSQGGKPPLTLWQAASRAHLKTSALVWPGTAEATIDFNCPETRPAVSNVAFDTVAQKCTQGLVERMAGAYPGFRKPIWNDETSMAALSYLLQHEQPDLALVNMTALDQEQRETGALSLYSLDLLENADELLGQLVSHLPPHTVIAVVSGHGFETEQHLVRPRVLVNSGAVDVRYGLIGTTDQRVAAALRKQLANKKSGIAREVSISEVRTFAPDLNRWVAAFGTGPGYIASEESKGPPTSLGNRKGVDGLWPTRPNYRSVFLLSGEGVRPGHLGEISVLHIAPTLASVLGVPLPDAKLPPIAYRLPASKPKSGT
jgi:predicted AlkP superfamily pyrophosphatase or phosphodiesterase